MYTFSRQCRKLHHTQREGTAFYSNNNNPSPKKLTSKTSGTESGWTSKTILWDDSPWANTRSPSTGVISSDASTPPRRASQWILDPPRRPNRLITRRVTWLGELLSWTDFDKESLSKPMKNERSFLGNGESSYWTSNRNGKIEVNRTSKKSQLARTSQTTWVHLAGISRFGPARKSSFLAIKYILYWPSLLGQNGWIQVSFFLAFLLTTTSSDQFRFLGNCPSTLPLTHVSALKSQISEKQGSGVGWVGSFLKPKLIHFVLVHKNTKK